MIKIYLLVASAIYAGLAVWCTLAPEKTARGVGLSFLEPAGRVEFLTVYGGLEAGMALFFALCAFNPSLARAGLLFGLVSFGALATWRLVSLLLISETGTTPFYLLSVEGLMFLAAAWLYFRTPVA